MQISVWGADGGAGAVGRVTTSNPAAIVRCVLWMKELLFSFVLGRLLCLVMASIRIIGVLSGDTPFETGEGTDNGCP